MGYGTDGVKGKCNFAEDESEQVRQDALRKLREYVSREELLLRSIVDDSSKEMEVILEDQKRLSEALLAIEKENGIVARLVMECKSSFPPRLAATKEIECLPY